MKQTSTRPPRSNRRVLPSGAAPAVMGLTAWVSVWVFLMIAPQSGLDHVAFGLIIGVIAAMSAGLTAGLIAPWFLEHTRFSWTLAAAMGLAVTALSFIPFGLGAALMVGVGGGMAVSTWADNPITEFMRAAGLIALVGGGISLPVTGPLGVAGGLICRALSQPAREGGGANG